MSARFSCCEICERSPTCGTDCGSCEGPPEEMATLAVRGSYPHGSTVCDQCHGLGRIYTPEGTADCSCTPVPSNGLGEGGKER
jgi:hypothetical protein